jgi:CubicO group peptidase (beta-lactamase class C family)
MLSVLVVLLGSLSPLIAATCYEPSPAFPAPKWKEDGLSLEPAFADIEASLREILSQDKYKFSSISVEVTSDSDTLWSAFHTATVQDEGRPGDQHVDSQSLYRVASITKTFTTLAILYQAKAGNLSLDDPVTKYIPEFNSSDYTLPWKDITIRSMASQLSGIPREFGQSDLLNLADDALKLGLPPVSKRHLPSCDEYVRPPHLPAAETRLMRSVQTNYKRPCSRSDMLERLKSAEPLFAPNQKSTYSNVNFDLLGLVIEQVTGVPYEEYIEETILKPLGMNSSTFAKPSDKHAVLPIVSKNFYKGGNYWVRVTFGKYESRHAKLTEHRRMSTRESRTRPVDYTLAALI